MSKPAGPSSLSASVLFAEGKGEPVLRDPTMLSFIAFWRALRGRLARMPARSDLQPDEMKPLLPWLSLIEVQHRPRRFRFRLVGTGIVDATGRDVTAQQVDAALFADRTDEVMRLFSIPVDGPYLGYAEGQCDIGPGDRRVPFVTTLAPLSTDGQRIDMLLGCLRSDRLTPGESVWKFHYERIERLPLLP